MDLSPLPPRHLCRSPGTLVVGESWRRLAGGRRFCRWRSGRKPTRNPAAGDAALRQPCDRPRSPEDRGRPQFPSLATPQLGVWNDLLVFVTLSLFLLGCMLYLLLITLIFYRFTFFVFA